jgi:hypothetical protein
MAAPTTRTKKELAAEDVKRLVAAAKKERRAREGHEAARAALVAELQTLRPPAAIREELATAAGLSPARLTQLVYAKKSS